MKITIKLYGTLRKHYPGYHHPDGIITTVPDGTTVAELKSFLDIQLNQNVTVIMDGKLQKENEKIIDGACLYIFQPVCGG